MTTGISAADRAHTIQVAIDPDCTAADLVQPGHVFPLRARPGGVLERTGQTEASVDLAQLAGLEPAGVICEIMNADGTMARVPELIEFCKQHDSCSVSITDLIEHRRRTEQLVEREVATCGCPPRYGDFTADGYAQCDQQAAPRARQGRRRGRRTCSCACTPMPHRRHLRLAALRLRRPAPAGAAPHRAARAAASCSTSRRKAAASAW